MQATLPQSAVEREVIRPDPRRFGTDARSVVYPYERYAYDYVTAWDIRGRGNRTYDMGLDHFVLTDGDDFDRVEFRVMGYTIDELVSEIRGDN